MIKLTPEESQLIRDGKLKPEDVESYRAEHEPVETQTEESFVPFNADLGKIKAELKEAYVLYRNSIQRNKDAYTEVANSRQAKADCRARIAELQKKKKELEGKKDVKEK